MRLTGPLSATLAALALAPLAHGADGMRTAPMNRSLVSGEMYEINDLRLTAGFMPENNEVDGQDYNWSHNYRLGIAGIRAPTLQSYGGLCYGGEVAFDNASKSVPGNETSVYRLMVDGMVGWAYRLGNIPNLHFEGTPFLGLGFSRFHDDIGGSPGPTLTYEYGLRAAAYYTFDNMWQAGFDMRYMITHAEPEFGGSVGSRSFETLGMAFLFSGGKRF